MIPSMGSNAFRMCADHDDVLDDLDGGLVWTEIETALRLNEMNISTGASVPFFFSFKLTGSPLADSTSLTKDHAVHGIEAIATLSSRHEATPIDHIAAT